MMSSPCHTYGAYSSGSYGKERNRRILEMVKSCGKEKDLLKARQLHSDIKHWILKDLYVSTALIRTYGNCGAVAEAQEIFDHLPHRDVVSWNALISGYVENKAFDQAVECYRRMVDEEIFPTSVTFICILKACASTGSLEIGEELHAKVREQGLLKDNVGLGNTLIDMYAKCGILVRAEEVFEDLSQQDVVSWSALIAGYAKSGLSDRAIKCLRQMENKGVAPDEVTYVSVLKACATIGSLEIGKEVHAKVRERVLLKKNIVLGNTLIDMYAKCGALKRAHEVFDELPLQDVVSWNALIAGYVEHGLGDQAIKCFKQMENARVLPDNVTYVCILKACALIGSLEIGEETHAKVREKGLGKSIVLGNTLIDMYAKCGELQRAHEVFDELPVRDVVSWTALIAGYARNGHGDQAMKCFRQMEGVGISPDIVSYLSILKACISVGCLEIGESIHVQMREQGLVKKNVAVGNALIDMYAKCGLLQRARDVLDELPLHDVISWNTLIAGYVNYRLGEQAVKCFREMEDQGISPDMLTYVCIFKACTIAGSLQTGKEIHLKMKKQELFERNIVIRTALIDMYAKCGALKAAHNVFDEFPVHDIMMWNALVAGYVENGCHDQAIECFIHMGEEGVSPDAVTYIYILKACATIGSLKIGQGIHSEVKEEGLLKDVVLGTALLDMYTKCGALESARTVFSELPQQDVVSWSAHIAGYAQLGEMNMVLNSFKRMRLVGIQPNSITFLLVMNACSHAALVEIGKELFHDMIVLYGLTPTVEHYTCMVDLFGRAGDFSMAKRFLLDNVSVCLAFLGACQKWMKVELGRLTFEKIIRLDDRCAAAYVCMRNIYTAAAMDLEADRME